MPKSVCPACNAPVAIHKIPKKKTIGIPVGFCTACGKPVKIPKTYEYAALKSRYGFFYSAGVLFVSLLLPAVVIAVLCLVKLYLWAYLSVLLVPLCLFLFLQIKKGCRKTEIANSYTRCAYKEYLAFLSANGVYVSPKALQQARRTIDAAALPLFGKLVKSEAFAPYLPAALVYKPPVILAAPFSPPPPRAPKFTAPANRPTKSAFSPEPVMRSNDIGSVEEYMHYTLKKYNLSCSEAAFQNIKIDILSYLEEHDAPNRLAVRRLIFQGLKQYAT